MLTLILHRLVYQLVSLKVGMICVAMTTDLTQVRFLAGMCSTMCAWITLAIYVAGMRHV